jgi:DNA-binding winged helix-turn-helix (wHTH) protein/Tol biopolymer transport system component
MAQTEPQYRPLQFGNFEVDVRAGELRKAGVKLKLSGQPFQVLCILLERPGVVATREELQKRLWPNTFVDVDHNLNTAINKIREVLGDSAESPRFVETLPRRGYRFIAPVAGGVPSSGQLAEEVPPAPPNTRRRPLHYALAFIGALFVTVGVLGLWQTVFRTQRGPRVLGFTKLTNDGQVKNGPMVTDGSRIYFTEWLPDGHSLVLQVSVKGGDTTPIAEPLKQPEVVDLSRDGTELLVASYEDKVRASYWVQPVAGGSPRRVGTVLGEDARFGPDGASVIYGEGHDIYSVNLDGASTRKLLSLDGTPFASRSDPIAFRFSPDGRVFRFTQHDHADTWRIMESAADGTGLREMFRGALGEWTPDGRFYLFRDSRNGDLWAMPEERSFPWRKRDDKPIQLTAGPLDFLYPSPAKNGKEVFATGASRRIEVVRYDSHSGEFVPYLHGISAEALAFSPDGQWVTYTTYPDGLLWRSRLDGSERLQLTFPPMRAFLPRWSPDAKQIAFVATLPDAAWNVYLVSSAGGTSQRVLPSEQVQMDANWSPNGTSLVFASVAGVSKNPIYIIDLRSRSVSTLPGSSGLFSPHWSPDGRYISAITVDPSHRLMLFDFTNQKWTEAFSLPMGWETWSRDGKYIYFRGFATPEVGDRILRLRLADRKVENIVDIQRTGRGIGGSFGGWFGLAPDDSPLVARDISTQEIYALEMDWP